MILLSVAAIIVQRDREQVHQNINSLLDSHPAQRHNEQQTSREIRKPGSFLQMISSRHKNHGNLARERIFAPLKCAHSLPPMICPLHSSALFRHAEKVRTGCRGETVHTQTFCRQFLIRNSVIFDVENFSPNRQSV